MELVPILLFAAAAYAGAAAYDGYRRRRKRTPGSGARGAETPAPNALALRHEAAALYAEYCKAEKQGKDREAAVWARQVGDKFQAAGNPYRALGMYHIARSAEQDSLGAVEILRQRLEFLPPGRFEHLRALHFLWQTTKLTLLGHYTHAETASEHAVAAWEAGDAEFVAEAVPEPIAPPIPGLFDAAEDDTALPAPARLTAVSVQDEFSKPGQAAFLISRDEDFIKHTARVPAQGGIIYRQAAHVAAVRQRYADAERYAIRAIEVSETTAQRAEALGILAVVRFYQGRLLEALALREQGVNEDVVPGAGLPKMSRVSHVGHVLQALGRHDAAAERFSECLAALQGSPLNRHRRNQRAICQVALAGARMEQGRLRDAVELLQASRGAYPPGHRLTMLARGPLLRIAAMTAAAPTATIREQAETLVADISEAMAQMPTKFDGTHCYHDSMRHAAVVFFEVGDPERCLEILDRYDEEDLVPVALPAHYYWSGRALEAMGDPEAAVAEYGRAAECDTEERHVEMARQALVRLRDGGG